MFLFDNSFILRWLKTKNQITNKHGIVLAKSVLPDRIRFSPLASQLIIKGKKDNKN